MSSKAVPATDQRSRPGRYIALSPDLRPFTTGITVVTVLDSRGTRTG